MTSTVSAAQGFYLGIDLLYNTIGGDFNGVNEPEVDPGGGVGVIVGYAFTPAIALQANLNTSAHNTNFTNNSSTVNARYREYIIGLKYNFLSEQKLQPFIRGGWGVFLFDTGKGFFDTGMDDEFGTGFDIGAGIDYYVRPQCSIGGGVDYKFVDYVSTSETSFNSSPGGSVNTNTSHTHGNTFSLNINAVYHFGVSRKTGNTGF